jgi:hypothetical protein
MRLNPLHLLRVLTRVIARRHHLAHVRDIDHVIDHHERLLLGLPVAIRRLQEIRRYHQGRAATLSQPRETVNFTLGSARVPR